MDDTLRPQEMLTIAVEDDLIARMNKLVLRHVRSGNKEHQESLKDAHL